MTTSGRGEGPERALPTPRTVRDRYLAAVLDELRGLRRDVRGGPTPPEPDAEELREPKD